MDLLKVQFGVPEHGWIALTIEHGGLKAHIHADSRFEAFHELIDALKAMWFGEEHASSTWHEEPKWAELHFMQNQGNIQLSCASSMICDLENQPSNQAFQVEGNHVEICLPFVQALLDLRNVVSEQEWMKLAQDDFPEQEFQNLLETFKAHPETLEHLKM